MHSWIWDLMTILHLQLSISPLRLQIRGSWLALNHLSCLKSCSPNLKWDIQRAQSQVETLQTDLMNRLVLYDGARASLCRMKLRRLNGGARGKTQLWLGVSKCSKCFHMKWVHYYECRQSFAPVFAFWNLLVAVTWAAPKDKVQLKLMGTSSRKARCETNQNLAASFHFSLADLQSLVPVPV